MDLVVAVAGPRSKEMIGEDGERIIECQILMDIARARKAYGPVGSDMIDWMTNEILLASDWMIEGLEGLVLSSLELDDLERGVVSRFWPT